MVEREILSHRLCSAHPHIVRFREVFLTPRYLAIAMEYAAGMYVCSQVQGDFLGGPF